MDWSKVKDVFSISQTAVALGIKGLAMETPYALAEMRARRQQISRGPLGGGL